MAPTEPDLTGALLEERYRVGNLLALGGMSRVYRGTDLRLDREVAIKVMDSRLAADPTFRGRFSREARAIARFDHPAIIDVYDQGEHGDPPDPVVFLVMELIQGGTLRDVLRERGRLSVAEAFAVLEPVLSALAAAHEQGMTHRDIKPENVLISRTGAVKVADFGLVTAAARTQASTAGMILGTVAYLSPEQVLGRPVDARGDVYSVGILLYELLTGVPPFDGDHALSVAYQHVNQDVEPPSNLVPDLPPELDALVVRATRRDPEARPPDARTLLHAVRGVRAALGVPRAPVPVPACAGAPVGVPTTPWSPTGFEARPGAGGRRPTKALTALTGAPSGHWRPEEPPPSWPEPADYLARRRRSRQLLAVGIAVVLLVAALLGAWAWGTGMGQWSAVPALVGQDQTHAEQLVTEAGLVPAVRQVPDNDVPAGTVAATDPAPATKLRKGSTVTLTVSTGRPRVPAIPPGTSVPDAERMLRDAGLTPREDAVQRAPHPTAPPGTVIGTSPAAGTVVAVSSPVSLVLSTGPAPARHPRIDDLGGSLGDLIRRQLERALGGG